MPEEPATDGKKPKKVAGKCINFGPDVTRAFLERNGLDMLVRSHEVPHGSRGYMSHHGLSRAQV